MTKEPKDEELEKPKEDEQPEEIDYKDKWLRAVADYQNLQKQTAREKVEWVKYANAGLILELIPVINHFKEAMKHIPEEQKSVDWVVGVAQIKKQFDEFLKNLGVEEIPTVGEQFSPELHEAVAQIDVAGAKAGEIVEEAQAGYKMGDKVIEPAKVIVAK